MVPDRRSTFDSPVFLYHVSPIISIDLLCFSVVVVICSLVVCNPSSLQFSCSPHFFSFFFFFYPAIPSVLVRLSAWLCTHALPYLFFSLSLSLFSDHPTVTETGGAYRISNTNIDKRSQRYWLWILYVSVARFFLLFLDTKNI